MQLYERTSQRFLRLREIIMTIKESLFGRRYDIHLLVSGGKVQSKSTMLLVNGKHYSVGGGDERMDALYKRTLEEDPALKSEMGRTFGKVGESCDYHVSARLGGIIPSLLRRLKLK